MTDRARLSDLGRRIDACIKHHGFTRGEMLARKFKWMMDGKPSTFTPSEVSVVMQCLFDAVSEIGVGTSWRPA